MHAVWVVFVTSEPIFLDKIIKTKITRAEEANGGYIGWGEWFVYFLNSNRKILHAILCISLSVPLLNLIWYKYNVTFKMILPYKTYIYQQCYI